MIFGADSLDQRIVQCLAATPARTAKELHETIVKRGTAYTLRGVYKELRKLERWEIVYRVKARYSIRFAWVTSLVAFSDRLHETYTSPEYLAPLLSSDTRKLVHRFTNLRRLDAYWIQLLMALQSAYPDAALYVWCPYQYFYLVDGYTATRFYRAEEEAKGRRFHIIGSDTFLDRRSLEVLPKSGTYSFAPGPFHDQRKTYFSLIGNHLITATLDEAITRKIDQLFADVKNERQMKDVDFQKIFGSTVKAVLTVEQNEKKAKRLRKRFAEYFGVAVE